MSNIKKIIISLFIASLSISSFAADKEGRRGKMKALKALNLTEQQITSLKEYRKENKGKHKESFKILKQLREEVKAAFISGASDEEIKSLHSRLQSEQATVKEVRFSKMLFMKNLLTKEQREKFMSMKKDKRHQGRGEEE